MAQSGHYQLLRAKRTGLAAQLNAFQIRFGSSSIDVMCEQPRFHYMQEAGPRHQLDKMARHSPGATEPLKLYQQQQRHSSRKGSLLIPKF